MKVIAGNKVQVEPKTKHNKINWIFEEDRMIKKIDS